MKRLIIGLASSVGKIMPRLQCDGSSGYACGGGAAV